MNHKVTWYFLEVISGSIISSHCSACHVTFYHLCLSLDCDMAMVGGTDLSINQVAQLWKGKTENLGFYMVNTL
jgi:hypothetical protein